MVRTTTTHSHLFTNVDLNYFKIIFFSIEDFTCMGVDDLVSGRVRTGVIYLAAALALTVIDSLSSQGGTLCIPT